jgi:peptidyl-prolyl cis-trans isomerase C
MPSLISFMCKSRPAASGYAAGLAVYFAGAMMACAAPEAQPAAPAASAVSAPTAAPMVLPPSFLDPPALAPAPDAAGIQDKPAALEALAAYFDKTPDVVVAEVAGTPITFGMVADNIRGLPPIWGGAPPRQVFDLVLNTLVQIRMLALKAKEVGVDKDPAAQRQVSAAVDRELASLLIKKISGAPVTDEALQEQYHADYADKPGPEEVWIRVIGATSKASAQEALDKINGGMDFASAVQAYSHDPSKDAGGDLGYVNPESLAPELRAVAFALAPGAVSAYPLQSNGLWYVLEVEGRRQRPAPPLSQVTNQLKGEIAYDAARSFILKTRADTTIKVYGVGGDGADKAAAASKK